MPSSRGAGGRPPVPTSTSQKKKKAAPQEQLPQLISPANLKHNNAVVYHLRVYATIVFGAAAGVMGIEGWAGLVLFLVTQLMCAVPLYLMAGGNVKRCFTGWYPLLLDHVFSQITVLSYILFWMIAYNLCHVF